jgi:endogenous inhibitor of DNA gyrase (YacG/DUF329 family)
MTTKSCPTCDKEFEAVLEFAQFCSRECEEEAASKYVEMKFTTAADMMEDPGEALGNKLLQAVKEMKESK